MRGVWLKLHWEATSAMDTAVAAKAMQLTTEEGKGDSLKVAITLSKENVGEMGGSRSNHLHDLLWGRKEGLVCGDRGIRGIPELKGV